MAHPVDYFLTMDGLILLAAWARDGLTDAEIAAKCKVSRQTLCLWKSKHVCVKHALARGKEVVDIGVENKLLESALGSYYTEEQAFKIKNVYYDEVGHKCSKEEVVVVELKKQRPPDVIAIIYWLKNRMRGKWMDKPTVESEDEQNALEAIVRAIKGAAADAL